MSISSDPRTGTFSGNHGVIPKEPGKLFPLHSHKTWEIILILDGSGYTEIEGKRYPFSPGTIFCIPPHFMHCNIPDEYYNDFCLGIENYLIPGDQVSVFQDDEYQTFRSLMEFYDRVYSSKPLNFGNILRSIEQLMQHLLISWQTRRPSTELLQLADTMRANISNPNFKVSDAIAQIPLNANYVRKQFRQVYGLSPVAFMNRLRLTEAKKYLLADDLPVSELALRCGFSDAKYFTRLFHNATGYSPLEYRKFYQNLQDETTGPRNQRAAD